MAFSSGTSASLAALIADLLTFTSANGWTTDENDTVNGTVGLHRGSCFVQFRYSVATPSELSIYQSLGWISSAVDPGAHTDDSGNGYNGPSAWSNANAALERHVDNIGNGPFDYFFYEDDANSAPYVHVVIQVSTDVYRHFGFGSLVKSNNWTGGEYCYGQEKAASGLPLRADETALLDGLFNSTSGSDENFAATLHCEGLPNQVASGKWGQVWGNGTANLPTDTAGIAKSAIQGGFRGGPLAQAFGNLGPFAPTSGFVNLIPIKLFYREPTLPRVHYLGYMPDVRALNIRFFAPRQVVNVGGVNWRIFPTSQKTTASPNGSSNSGIAYAERA